MSTPSPQTPPSRHRKLSANHSPGLLDQSLSPGAILDTSMNDLHLADTPLAFHRPLGGSAATASSLHHAARQPKSRPSWGSAALLDAPASAKARGKMRFLQNIDQASDQSVAGGATTSNPPMSGATRAGAGRPRFSLFAKPGLPSTQLTVPKPKSTGAVSDTDEDLDGDLSAAIEQQDPADSAGPSSSSSRSAAPAATVADDDNGGDDDDDSFLREAILGKGSAASDLSAAHDTAEAGPSYGGTCGSGKETADQVSRQLHELKRLNTVFEAYETALRGSAGQLEAFAQRIGETDDLLNIYIDLLRQTERTQQLLHESEWKGTTQDAEEVHRLEIEMQERETRRLQAEAQAREEAQRAAAEAAERAQRKAEEAEHRKIEAQRLAAERGTARGRGRGTGSAVGTRGTAVGARDGVARTASTSAATRGRGATARPASTGTATARSGIARGASTGLGRGRPLPTSTAGGRSVSSSSSGARTASSGIPTRATSSAGLGGQYANVKSSGYGRR
ncbi:hypothetical protein ACQY0O_002276 [Thecaphora frezii]